MKQDELKELDEVLETPLDTNDYNQMANQLVVADAWRSRVSTMYREAERALAEKKNKFLEPKSKDTTDMDRKIRLEANTADYQEDADKLKDLAEILQGRISLGQSLLKSHLAEVQGGLK